MAIQATDIKNMYQSTLGRAPSSSEMNYLLDNAATFDPMTLQTILRGHPEAQQKQLQAQGEQYSKALGANDQTILGQTANQIQGGFGDLGRGQGSSGMSGQMAQAGQNLAMDRNSALAQFYGQGYSGIQNASQQNGANAQSGATGQIYGQQNMAIQNQYNMDNWNNMFQTEQNAYQGQLNSQLRRARAGAIGSTIGTIGGAVIGAYAGGPGGAKVGAGLGAQLGGSIGGQARYF